jgi:hypothetical protein
MGEQFKRVQVIMLPTESGSLIRSFDTGKLRLLDTTELFGHQHLYIISDDEIIEGNWVLHTQDKNIFKVNERYDNSQIYELNLTSSIKKIIATTDTSLQYTKQKTERGNFENLSFEEGIHKANFKPTYISKPSQQFILEYIESYNKGKIITDILVEYEPDMEKALLNYYSGGTLIDQKPKIKFKDNTINIKPIKDSWSREELFELFSDYENENLRLNKDKDAILIKTSYWLENKL